MNDVGDDKTILCLCCRSRFSKAELDAAQASACPACGSKDIPADLGHTHTLQLTDHEWRVLFMWAERWAEHHDTRHDDGVDMLRVLRGIAAEARRQEPTLPNLSLMDDVQDLVTMTGRPGTLARSDGIEVTVMPAMKN